MSISNKKFLIIFVCILKCLYIYAESGTLGYFIEPGDPHHEYKINNNGRQSRYRIQMHTPHYAFFVDAETCCCYEYFPNYEMGISRESGSTVFQKPNFNELWIFPEIIFKDENLKELFSIKEYQEKKPAIFITAMHQTGKYMKKVWFLMSCCWMFLKINTKIQIKYKKSVLS